MARRSFTSISTACRSLSRPVGPTGSSPQVEVSGYHIHFRTPDFEELLDWYVDVFGREVRPLGTIQTTTNVPGMGGRSTTSGSELDDLEAFTEQLKAKGIEFNVEYREIDSIEPKIAFITDPSGVYIELTEGYDAY